MLAERQTFEELASFFEKRHTHTPRMCQAKSFGTPILASERLEPSFLLAERHAREELASFFERDTRTHQGCAK